MKFTKNTSKKNSAFTLIELLVVTAISGVLLTLGFTAARGAIEKVQATKCLSSLRQIGTAIQLYVGENQGRLPDTGHVREDGVSLSWTNTLSVYLGTNLIGRCPVNRQSVSLVTYGWNDNLTEATGNGVPVTRCRTPASTLVVAETSDSYNSEHFHFAGSRSRVTFNQFKRDVGVSRHGTAANYLFVDGHTERLLGTEVKNRLDIPNSSFLIP